MILLNGHGILRANYPDLDTACYVGDGNNAAVAAAGGGYFRADNSDGSSPNIAGIYLILPETRGYVPRGLDTAASVDPDGASRYLGNPQLDAFQGHLFGIANTGGTHNVIVSSTSTGGNLNGNQAGYSSVSTQPQVLTTAALTDGVNGTPRIDSESRMVNYADVMAVVY